MIRGCIQTCDFGVEDRNGDGFIDAITSKIFVPDDATAEELAAAANLAARLAFETVSTTVLQIERIRLPRRPDCTKIGVRPLTFARKRRVIKGLSSDRNHF